MTHESRGTTTEPLMHEAISAERQVAPPKAPRILCGFLGAVAVALPLGANAESPVKSALGIVGEVIDRGPKCDKMLSRQDSTYTIVHSDERRIVGTARFDDVSVYITNLGDYSDTRHHIDTLPITVQVQGQSIHIIPVIDQSDGSIESVAVECE